MVHIVYEHTQNVLIDYVWIIGLIFLVDFISVLICCTISAIVDMYVREA